MKKRTFLFFVAVFCHCSIFLSSVVSVMLHRFHGALKSIVCFCAPQCLTDVKAPRINSFLYLVWLQVALAAN